MKVLFVCSGNSKFGISPILQNQSDSLKAKGIAVDFFLIKGKGITGYLKGAKILRKKINKNKYDVIHAHYLFSAITATLAGAKPLVVSLMGSDINSSKFNRRLAEFFNKLSWAALIVKSDQMKASLKNTDAMVIPNGVNFQKFKTIDREVSLQFTGWDRNKKNVLFAANPIKWVKNYQLARQSVSELKDNSVNLNYLENVPNDDIPFYMNAADVVLLTSRWEGSPNVIKEAMACARPIVCTDVGDVKELLEDTEGCYVADHNSKSVSKALKEALKFKGSTNGRKNIERLREEIIADKIIELYKNL